MPNITIHDGGSAPSRFQVSFDEQVTIGRSVDCDIVVGAESVSGMHAVFEPMGNSYQLRDLGSTNGIKQDGVLSDSIELTEDGDVEVGDLSVHVSFIEEELIVMQPHARQMAVTVPSQVPKKFNSLNLIAVLILIGIGGAVYLNQAGYFKQDSTTSATNDTQDDLPKPPKPAGVVKTEAKEPEEPTAASIAFAASIDPATPPERLRIRLQKSGGNRTLVLDKMQTRRDDYQLLLVEADGEAKELAADTERNYSGYCEEEPDSLVAAYLHRDGSLTLSVFKAEQIKGTGAKTDWGVEAIKEFELLTDAAISPRGKPLQGASWVESNSRRHPLYNDNYSYDLGFEYQSTYIKNFSEDSTAGYEQMQFRADYSNAMFSLVSIRDLLIESKVAKIVIRKDNLDWSIIYQDWLKRFGAKPIDTVAFMDGNGPAGGYGYQKNRNHRHDFKISKNGGALPWGVFRHETGHYLGVGDMAGGAREGATIVNGNQFSRWSMPALKAVIEVDRAKHLTNEQDKKVMVSIGKAKIQVPPYAYADEIYIAQGGSQVLDILANDFDANGQQLALAGFEKTSVSGGHIKWNVAEDGGRDTLEYTAPPNFTGLDRFSYSIVDKTGRVAHGNVLINLSAPGLQAYWDFENTEGQTEIPSQGASGIVAKQAKEKPQLNWKQTAIEEMREWDVSKIIRSAGKHKITLSYRRGDSAFITKGCALELNGKVISKDVHEGFAGFPHLTKNNVYQLHLKKDLKPDDKLVLKAQLKLGKNRENLSSEGQVLIESRSVAQRGKKGGGLKLNGKQSLALPTWRLNSKSITIAAWVKSESWKGGTWGPRIIQMAGRGQAWRLNAEHGKMAFCIGDVATKKWDTEGLLITKAPAENKWVHIAAVSDGRSMKIYYDGELVAEKKRVGPIEDSSSGGSIGTGFKGIIDELYVFNKPLSQEEVVGLMKKGSR